MRIPNRIRFVQRYARPEGDFTVNARGSQRVNTVLRTGFGAQNFYGYSYQRNKDWTCRENDNTDDYFEYNSQDLLQGFLPPH